ncbi:DUF6468 domain-containing protein [Brevundimonas sp. GCM10030266]|uniref:DUF6468 domain-containing protein n=1 Tax=Brevundimonas sp. GCM10030266 TaxID=3273386 RepID=UPI0036077F20
MTGMILDGILMLLLVAALGYGVRLERKLSALRAGQQAFASAVTELNAAAGRAEAALASLRASGQETDLLHDRIIKAREVKTQLETLIARGGEYVPARSVEPRTEARPEIRAAAPAPRPAPVAAPVSEDDARAARMQALAERIQGMAAPARPSAAAGNVHAILGAMTRHGAANQSAKQSLNQARRNLDDDIFAA